MRVLMVNNRLKVYGGEGTYMTAVGEELRSRGHAVQYFGLEDEDKLHGNEYGIYARKSKDPVSIIKNNYNVKQFARILDAFEPDIIHINLIYFTLTPAILAEASKRSIPVVQTVHDGKIVCPAHLLFVSRQERSCTECRHGDFSLCIKNRCHKNSLLMSLLAYNEAVFNQRRGYYELIDKFVFPSRFMRDLHVEFGVPRKKTTVLCNFSRVKKRDAVAVSAQKYVVFFGQIIQFKGIRVLAEAMDLLPDVKFVVAGTGDLAPLLQGKPNCELVGFVKGKELEQLIAGAVCTVLPSVGNENCPMSVLESIALGTPVIGSDMGGIPELIDVGVTGFVVKSGDAADLAATISRVYHDDRLIEELSKNCLLSDRLMDVAAYTDKAERIYEELLGQRN